MIKKIWPFVLSFSILAAGAGCASTQKSQSAASSPAASSTATVTKAADSPPPAPQTPAEARIQKKIDAHVDQIGQEKRSKFRLQSLFR
ncbi:MAG: hypothetical protein ACE15F_10155 [bacterium]